MRESSNFKDGFFDRKDFIMNTENNRQVRQDACQHTAKITVTNSNDIKNFCKKIGQIPEFEKLTSDQKLRIACCYPVETAISLA